MPALDGRRVPATTETRSDIMKTNNETPATEIPPELRPSCLKIRGLMATRATGDTKVAYQIGAEVFGITKETEKYGRGSVKLLAGELGCTAALLYSYARVAAAWNPEEFKEATKKANAKGLPLTFSHFVELAREEESKAAREHLFALALRESLDRRGTLIRCTSCARGSCRRASLARVPRAAAGFPRRRS